MATSNVEEAAARLLAAFHNLSGGLLTQPVPLRDDDLGVSKGAAFEAGLDPDSTLPDIALRYLLNKGWLKQEEQAEAGAEPVYVLTVAGADEARRLRGPGS